MNKTWNIKRFFWYFRFYSSNSSFISIWIRWTSTWSMEWRFFVVLGHVQSQCIFGPEYHLAEVTGNGNSFQMIPGHMQFQCISGTAYCLAEVAGNGNPFQMVCFNVILQSTIYSLLTTYCATIQQLTVFILFECLCHHWDAFFVKFLHIPREVACPYYRSFSSINVQDIFFGFISK